MRHRLYVHLVWTTRDREPLITSSAARFLLRFFPAIAAQERAQVLACGILTTHVHLLLRLNPATAISRLVQRLKGGSAMVATREGHMSRGQFLRWAKGYTVESVSPRALPDVAEYIGRQPEHHPKETIRFVSDQ